MDLSVQEFLDSVSNVNTERPYRFGIRRFCEWFGKSGEEVLELRKDDLTQRQGENIIDFRNRAARFEKAIEKFHSYLRDEGFSVNSARSFSLGIQQLFRFYQMPMRMRNGSAVSRSTKSNKNFPLNIEHVRAMFKVGDLRERVVLGMATDLGLRIGDFIAIKKADLPSLDQESPISFDIETAKEDVIAYGFLSQETLDLLKVYMPTLDKDGNPYLFPSNGKGHISDEWMNKLIQNLAEKAQLNLNGKDFTFHCFRKMFLSAAIDSGIGDIAGKKLCGKSIPQSDDTYPTTIHLREKFIQLKKFLTITELPQVETEKISGLKSAVLSLQQQLIEQKLITDTIAEQNAKLKPLFDFLGSIGNSKEITTYLMNLQTAVGSLKGVFIGKQSDENVSFAGNHKFVVESHKVNSDHGQTAKTIRSIESSARAIKQDPRETKRNSKKS